MDDNRIVALYWERSEAAVRETEQAYGRYCAAIAKNVLGNRQDAEECVNDAYLRLWNAIPPERPASLRTYLAAVVRNLAMDRRRAKLAGKRGGGQYAAVWEELAHTLAAKDSVEDMWDASRLTGLLNRFLDGLPREKRLIFVMRYWYLDPIDRIAKRLELSVSKVKMTLHRTRKELKEYLTKEGIDL